MNFWSNWDKISKYFKISLDMQKDKPYKLTIDRVTKHFLTSEELVTYTEIIAKKAGTITYSIHGNVLIWKDCIGGVGLSISPDPQKTLEGKFKNREVDYSLVEATESERHDFIEFFENKMKTKLEK